MTKCKTAVTPLLTHWSYCSLALSHRHAGRIVESTSQRSYMCVLGWWLLVDWHLSGNLSDIQAPWKVKFEHKITNAFQLDKIQGQIMMEMRMRKIKYSGVPFAHRALRWRHNGRDSVSNHQSHHCLLNRLFRRRSKKTSKIRVTGLCEGNSPGTGEFPAQMASDAENVSIWWRHHGVAKPASESGYV